MRIVLNGESREVPEACSVASLLAQLQIKGDGVAVEVNLNIVDRRAFEATRLQDGDRVEVIGFIGGGGGTRSLSWQISGSGGSNGGCNKRRNPEELSRRP